MRRESRPATGSRTDGVAYLGMYDRPETAAANDALWTVIQEELGRGPETLSRDADPWSIWTAPNLLFAQTCGCPFRTRLYGKVQLVATPDYGVPDCAPGYYYSVFVARKSDAGRSLSAYDGQRFAYNDSLSQSGWAGPMIHMQDLGILPGALVETGGHRASAEAVATGQADFSALDAVSWQLMKKFDDFANDLVEVERTSPTPGLPFITSLNEDPMEIFSALERALPRLDDQHRSALHLREIISIPTSDYLAVPTPLGPVLTQQKINARWKG